MPASTPPSVIFIVVCTLAFLAIVYVGTMAASLLGVSHAADNQQVQALSHAGDTILGALVAALMNTRTQQPPSA